MNTRFSIAFQGRSFHSYTGVGAVLMTCVLLLVSLSSKGSCRRQHILGVTPGFGFFGNPVTISIQLTLAPLMREQEMVVSSFLRSVLRCGRRVLCTGFRGGELWSLTRCQAPILSHFGQANNLCRLVAYDDPSNVPLLALAVAACSRIERCRVQRVSGFLPASGIDGQSLPWGRCLSLFTRGWR